MLTLFTLLPLHAGEPFSTEVRDYLRGVTFYNMHVSTASLTTLQMQGSSFSSPDRMTLGFSAFFFVEHDGHVR